MLDFPDQIQNRILGSKWIDQMTVTQLMAFVSSVVRVYITGNWTEKTLNISEMSYEFQRAHCAQPWDFSPIQ
jgi:hypothetical protein